jgi:hypothetical protein
MNNSLQLNSSANQDDFSNVEIAALALSSYASGVISFINPRTSEAVNICGKRTMINRTTLYNAVLDYVNQCERLV